MKYPFTVYQTIVEEHVFWIAECPALRGCVGQGETLEEAVKELEENEHAWIDTAKEYGIEIPEVPVKPIIEHSGKFTVRVAPHVHEQAVKMAESQGVSLNQYVNDAIVAQNSSLLTANALIPHIQETIHKIKLMATSVTSESKVTSYTTMFANVPQKVYYQ